MKIPFDPSTSSIEVVRQIVFERLQQERGQWHHLDQTGDGFRDYVDLPAPEARRVLLFHSQQIYVELLAQGVIAPGFDTDNINLPWFHITEYGKTVLDSVPANPYFPPRYLSHLRAQLPTADDTVLAYLSEALDTFARGNQIPATVMVGIAAERVFLLLCDSLLTALADISEKKKFQQVLDKRAMKPKLDWVRHRFEAIRGPRFPDNAGVMVGTVYDLLRLQRNDLGHPRETPPSISRSDAFVNLQVFPRYYVLAEQVRAYLASHAV